MVPYILDSNWFYPCSDENIVSSDLAVDFRSDWLVIPWSTIAPNSILRVLRFTSN
jgi:hypothetical protein